MEKCISWSFFFLFLSLALSHLLSLSSSLSLSLRWGKSVGCAELAYGNAAAKSQRTQAVRSELSLKQTAERCIITSANAEPVQSPPPHTATTAASRLLASNDGCSIESALVIKSVNHVH